MLSDRERLYMSVWMSCLILSIRVCMYLCMLVTAKDVLNDGFTLLSLEEM